MEICLLTGQPHRLIDTRVGGSYLCQDCRQKVLTCCEGPVMDPLPDPVAIREARIAASSPALPSSASPTSVS